MNEQENSLYAQFLEWAEGNGFEFPCTAGEFHARASRFAAGDDELIVVLCNHGIGPDWRE